MTQSKKPPQKTNTTTPAQKKQRKNSTTSANSPPNPMAPWQSLLACITVFLDEQRCPYASLPMQNHEEHWPIGSAFFQTWCYYTFYNRYQRAPSAQRYAAFVQLCRARAFHASKTHRVYQRMAQVGNTVYWDCGDNNRCVLTITPNGWRVDTMHR